MTHRRYVTIKAAIDHAPVADDFVLAEGETEPLQDGDILIRTRFMSLDPYIGSVLRGRHMQEHVPQAGDLIPCQVIGDVIESRSDAFAVGDLAATEGIWSDHVVAKADQVRAIGTTPSGAPLSVHLGVLGMPGLTAFAGMCELAKVGEGDTVLISAAAGPVGGTAGQIARIHGAKRVVGVAGSDEKCRMVTERYGFDACVNYKEPNWQARIAEECPNGVDVYFDNVGGAVLDAALANINKRARIPVCGVLSAYNEAGDRYGVQNMHLVFDKTLTIQGFLLADFRDRWEEARGELEDMVANGSMKDRETIAEGIDNAPDAFIGMLQGANQGKQLVKLV